MTLVQPANEHNAIKIAAFAFAVQPESITHSILEKIQSHYTAKQFSDYNNIAPHNSIVVNFTDNNQEITSDALGGLSLLKVDGHGNKIWETVINKDTIIVTCYRYTRWNEIFEKAKNYVKEILNLIDKDLKITGLTLEYIDEFTVLNNSDNRWKKELFLEDTKYLPSHIFEVTNPWHSHHGFFFNGNELLNQKILINLNIEYVITNQSIHNLVIRSQQRSLLDSAIDLNQSKIDTSINAAMVENHKINKNLLRDLLSEGALQSINLGESND
ncbi:MAG: TIGR04255 family protein [Sulfurovum sp.]|nr:TIGR04255 family protein [Sulfurovum sp.]